GVSWPVWEKQAGIVLNGGAKNGAVGNDIEDMGSHGVLITGGDRRALRPAGNHADNNVIHATGVDWKQGVGVSVAGVGNRVSHNLIYDTPRMGIIFSGNDHIIEYNHIHHVGLE